MRKELEIIFDRLWPINRSLTGNGNRESLKILSEIVDLQITEVPSGTKCFDWDVPPEWNVKEAWIKDSKGKTIVDFSQNNLHLLGYSIPVNLRLSLVDLKSHIYTLPDQPDLVPYLTSYYEKRWGFCLSHSHLISLEDDEYWVYIDSDLDYNGSMTLGDAILKGTSDREILLSTYICHPSMASDVLSGLLVTSFLYREIKKLKERYYTYRFVFIPETIGSIYYLTKHGDHLRDKLDAGFVITCIGDNGSYTYKRSRQGDSLTDRCTEIILRQTERNYTLENFFPGGSDERQYCSIGFNLPVGSLMRTRYGIFPQYHTSGDNKDYISFESMEKSICKYLDIMKTLENNFHYVNTMPFCEPHLGKRGLYPTLGSQKTTTSFVYTMMWILCLADGSNDLIDISEKSNIPIHELLPVIKTLMEEKLIKRQINAPLTT